MIKTLRFMTLAAMTLLTSITQAAVVYDAGGFEAPRFTLLPSNALAGQDILSGPWVKDSGTSTAIIQTNNTSSGLPNVQALLVERVAGATGNTRWHVPAPVTPTAALNGVQIDFDISVNIPASLTAGPRFGIEAYDATGATPKLIGSVLFDAAQGSILYDATGSGAPTSTGTFLTRNAYHHLTLLADFTRKTYSISADGVLLHTENFVDPTATAFSYAPIVALSANQITETGRAYFDSYTISTVSVPEPSAVSLLVLSSAILLKRRSRHRMGTSN